MNEQRIREIMEAAITGAIRDINALQDNMNREEILELGNKGQYIPKPEKKKRGRPKKLAMPEKSPSEDFTMNKRRELFDKTVRAGKNTWVDEGEAKNPEDKKIVVKKTARVRPKASMVDVVCSACNRKVSVPSSLQRSDYYRCERCVR
jgi:hypothetical protein